MKKLNLIPAMILFIMAGCGKGNNQSTDNFITVDVTANYPKKELILQDFMDVEYIPLETKDDFITTGWLHAISKEIIIVRNRRRSSDGDIFIFDRNGKALRKINHRGEGSKEYTFLLGVTLDEDNNEIFVNDHFSEKILVYDLFGNFKRSFNHKENRQYHMEIYNFDRNHLICRDNALDKNWQENQNVFLIISKQDGSIIKEIEIPYKEKVSSILFPADRSSLMPIRNRTLVPHGNNCWMLMENSSDTIYDFFSDYSMVPLIIRTPSIQSMKPSVFLYPAVLTDQYCFMQTVKAEWDWVNDTGHKRTNLMYDKQMNAIFEYVMYNADIDNKQPITVTSEITFGNKEIAFVQILEAPDLVEAYGKGQLKGKLKEIAAGLNEESNPVIMLAKYRK